MKVYNLQGPGKLTDGLLKALDIVRAKRGFNPRDYISAKCSLLNDYMEMNHLKACVIGISGGIDSAIALALTIKAAAQENSPIKKVLPLALPIYTKGASNQNVATERALHLTQTFGAQLAVVDLTKTADTVEMSCGTLNAVTGDGWAEGQLASYIRTPVLYYAASRLCEEGLPAIVVGTTNRDEGAYLGFFGKASDAMVDVQLISDLHKNEILQIAKHLEIPEVIRTATPSGDMYDGRSDEEVFGAPYDFVELYLSLRCLGEEERAAVTLPWNKKDRDEFDLLASRLERLHIHNKHKYKVGSPAVHLDIFESSVPGGWQQGSRNSATNEILPTQFVGPFNLPDEIIHQFDYRWSPTLASSQKLLSPTEVLIIEDILKPNEIQLLLAHGIKQEWIPVGINGKLADYEKESSKIGSLRASTYNTKLADILWWRLSNIIPQVLNTSHGTNIDTEGATVWKAIGINPLFRFIRYEEGCSLVAHYDAPHDFKDGRKTLKSLLLYLTNCEEAEGGATRFLIDPQHELPTLKRNYADWTRPAHHEEVAFKMHPRAGHALIFDHRLLHDCEPLNKSRQGQSRIVIRTDLIYKEISYK